MTAGHSREIEKKSLAPAASLVISGESPSTEGRSSAEARRTMNAPPLSVFVALALVFAVGCSSSPEPRVTDASGCQSVVRAAPADGIYALTGRPDAPEHRNDPLVRDRRPFKEGEPIGFERTSEGMFAVAGDLRAPLPEGRYAWCMEPATPEAANGGTSYGSALSVLGPIAVGTLRVVAAIGQSACGCR
jgi:hypothetical protein